MFKKTFKPLCQRFKSFFKHSWPLRKCLNKLLNLWPDIPQTLKKSLKLWVGSVCSADRGGAREPRILYPALLGGSRLATTLGSPVGHCLCQRLRALPGRPCVGPRCRCFRRPRALAGRLAGPRRCRLAAPWQSAVARLVLVRASSCARACE